jgi:elongation factor Ts
MHVVAAKPLYLRPQHVLEDVLTKEKEILTLQLADSGKPADILEKIVNGKLRKLYEGVCLTEQPHMVEEGNPKVSKVLEKLGMQVTHFELKSIA